MTLSLFFQIVFALFLVVGASSFTVFPRKHHAARAVSTRTTTSRFPFLLPNARSSSNSIDPLHSSSSENDDNDNTKGLKLPTSEADYVAAARKRAQAHKAGQLGDSRQATDDDWSTISENTDWVTSLSEEEENDTNQGSSGEDENDTTNTEQGLVLDDLDTKMSELSSKLPTSESDYVAAARKRAELHKAGELEDSRQASDEDWSTVSNQTEWVASLNEDDEDAGIIIEGGEKSEEDDGEEPKLLLF